MALIDEINRMKRIDRKTMKNCPKCANSIPFKEFLFVSNFRNIQCPHCKEKLLPDKIALSVIGGISGFAAAATVGVALIVHLLTQKIFLAEIIIATIIFEISIIVAATIITRNTLKLTLKNKNHEKS